MSKSPSLDLPPHTSLPISSVLQHEAAAGCHCCCPVWSPSSLLHAVNADPASRHGARLDAADPSWHLTSPTPYDPPLTYGGWTQCRALGARIASLLQTREDALEAETPPNDNPPQASPHDHSPLRLPRSPSRPRPRKRKTHRVILHTSPFLRCIQTAVAIGAGMRGWPSSPRIRCLVRAAVHVHTREGNAASAMAGWRLA